MVIARWTSLSRLPAHSRALSIVAWWMLSSACGGGTTSVSVSGSDASSVVDGDSSKLPCEIESVLATHCVQCHASSPQFGAPMPLVTYADLHANAPPDPLVPPPNGSSPIYKVVGTRIHDTKLPMPQPPNAPLDATARATLDAWIAAGAPAATTEMAICSSDAGSLHAAGDAADLACAPDEHLASAAPWVMPAATDDVYVCYGVELGLGSKRQVIGMEPRIDNHKIVHHALLFQADAPVSTTPAPCNSGGDLTWRIVYGWAPGGKMVEMPADVGFAEDASTHYVVQIHYNNIQHLANQTDSSGFDLCSTDTLRKYDADVMAFGTMNITIAPHSTLDETCAVTVPSFLPPLHMFAAFPHMHELGNAIATEDLPGGNGTAVSLGGQPTWSFQNQLWFPINATVNPGDVVKTRCAWNNTTNNTVSFGPYTENEMCYSFTMYYPKITLSGWSWIVPAESSTCGPTH